MTTALAGDVTTVLEECDMTTVLAEGDVTTVLV